MTSDLDYPSHLGARDTPDHPDATYGLAERVHGLEKTVSRLCAALATRETIGMAKGILIATEHCNPDEAFDMLKARIATYQPPGDGHSRRHRGIQQRSAAVATEEPSPPVI